MKIFLFYTRFNKLDVLNTSDYQAMNDGLCIKVLGNS